MDQDADGLPAHGDVVDRMQREWARLRPDLSFTSLGVIHRVLRASRLWRLIHHQVSAARLDRLLERFDRLEHADDIVR